MNEMNVLFFTLNYKSGMYLQLADEFILNGHKVTFVSPTNIGKNRIEKYKQHNVLLFRSNKLINVSLIRKGIANLLMPYQCKRAVSKFISHYDIDLILMSTPTLGFYESIKYLKKRNRDIRFYLILRDIHPEGAKFVGLDKYKILYNYFRSMEKSLYNCADRIGCMSPHSMKFISNMNPEISKSKVELLPNWGTINNQNALIETNILEKYGLIDKFLVIYGGNMGIAQNLGIFIRLAKEKSKYKDVVFIFVGDGTEKKQLKKQADEIGANNVIFINSLPKKEYDELVKVSHLGIISLHPKSFFANIPSKTIGYMSARVPILASIDSISDYGNFVIDPSKAGLWSLANEFEKLSENFDIMYHNPILRNEMGENGYQYFINNWTTDKTYAQIIKSIQNEN